MRLLTWDSHDDLHLTQTVSGHQIPPYAILSHTWGPDGDEVSFADLQHGRAGSKIGYRKLQFCSEQARKDQIKHFWIDTCCIDKSDGVELSEAINSMYRWYRDAEKCYVYLSDVFAKRSGNDAHESAIWESSLRKSRWFTRGWTLQELLAPKVVEFFSHDGVFLGTKRTLAEQISEITALPLAALYGTPPAQFPIAERWRWAQGRQTTKPEDGAYCLFGIFDVFMPLIYGEGNHAFLRLEEKVTERSGVSSYLPPSDNLMARSLASRSRPALTQHLYVDDEYTERALKRRRVVHTGVGNVEDDGQAGDGGRRIDGKKRDMLLKSLLFERIDFRVNNVKKALFSTCEWLLCHPHFRTWYESGGTEQSSGFLWIKGKPGCGKSTLMKVVVDWTRRNTGRNSERDVIVPYFFNARASTSLEKSSLGLYRTVVHHLLSCHPQLLTLFAEKFLFKDPGLSGSYWTSEELQDFLHVAVESNLSFRLCLFIDALDEAEFEDDVRQMISFLVQLSDQVVAAGSPCRLQICLSSRHYPHIRVGRGVSLVVEEQLEHGEDIEAYITKQLTCLDGSEKDELRAEIRNKSAHIFLWVVLVVEILNKLDDHGASLSEMRAHLETIPAGLNELFKEILTRSDHGVETSMLFFQWMVFRMRPLEPAEMFVAMEYSRSPHDTTWVPPAKSSVPPPDRLARFILNCSRGLAEPVEVADPQTTVVQFIHETVREFLLKENGLAAVVPALAANLTGISHEILRVACLRRIAMHQNSTEYGQYCETGHMFKDWETFQSDVRRNVPFVEYAVSHLFDHAEQAEQHNISQETFLRQQMDVNGRWLDLYRQSWNMFERYESKKVMPETTLIYFIAEEQHSSLISVLLDVSNSINTVCGRHGSVLHMASLHDFREIVQMLLDKDVNVNIQAGPFGSALQVASVRGRENIVQMLLDAGADVNAQGGHFGNALQAASYNGHKKTVNMLLDGGADVNTRGGRYSSALQAASCYGHEQVVQMLLDAGADVNAQGGMFGNALQAASFHSRGKIVQMLLEAGANQSVPYWKKRHVYIRLNDTGAENVML